MSTWDELLESISGSSVLVQSAPRYPPPAHTANMPHIASRAHQNLSHSRSSRTHNMSNDVIGSQPLQQHRQQPNSVTPIPAGYPQLSASRPYQFPPLTLPNNPPIAGLHNSKDTDDLPGADLDCLSPYLRPRLCTWGSTVSDSGCSEISVNSTDTTVSQVSVKTVRNASPPLPPPPVSTTTTTSAVARRRYTCPSSMRTYQRKANGSIKRACPRISDVESDISDDVENGHSAMDTDSSENHNHGSTNSSCCVVNAGHMGNLEFSMLRQPESHHRARYQKEGSRGCIKDRTGNSCPAVQLKGYNGPSAVIQAFIGTETGPVRPHPLYRVCKVGGKHSTPCRERLLDTNIYAFEMDITRDQGFVLNVDCLGIMKLRNADFEQLTDAEDLAKRRKRSPKVRLIFRCVVTMPDGSTETMQVVSTPICCTPSPGLPEIHFVSHTLCPVAGGLDIVIIGRNFVKDDSKIVVVEKNDDEDITWEREVPLLQENFNQVHLVGSMPAYRDLLITQPTDNTFLYVRNKGGKQSEPCAFKYTPDDSVLRQLVRAPAPPPIPVPIPAPRPPLATVASFPHLPLYAEVKTAPHLASIMRSNSIPTPTVISPPASPGAPLTTSTPSSSPGAINAALQYCIQLPGSNQPIFITIPQMENGGSSPFLSGQAVPNVQQQNNVITVDLSQLPAMRDDPMLHSGVAPSPPMFDNDVKVMPMNGGNSRRGSQTMETNAMNDEDLFNELLREILGPTKDDAMGGLGYPSDNAAQQAASSLSALDINFDLNANDYYNTNTAPTMAPRNHYR